MGLSADDLIVITGGAGFIAKYVIQELNRQNFTNIVLFERYDKLNLESLKNLQGLIFRSLESHVNLEDYLDDEKDNIRCVIHLGANSSTTGEDSEDYLWNNYECSKLLLDFCTDQDVRFIYASSASVYGDGSNGFDDSNFALKELSPLNVYGWTKLLFDQYVINNQLEEKVLGLRLFNIFGSDRSKGDMRCIVTRALEMIQQKKKMEIFDVKSERDFVWARDVARFIVESIEKKSCGIVNFGTGSATSFKTMCDHVFHAMEQDPHYAVIALPEHLQGKYQHHTMSDPARLNEMLQKHKYHFKFTHLQDAVRATVQELGS
ncbi:MAG: NAD-dependent epimerase/dehydratase family protein [Chlamydiia bacterium]